MINILMFSNSESFDHIKEEWGMASSWEIPSWLNTTNVLYVLFVVLILISVKCIKDLLTFLNRRADSPVSCKNTLFVSSAVWVFCSGVLLYYIGYDYAGTNEFFITLLLRSVLSSFEMFLSKSNLVGIADNCKDNINYMLFFAVIHSLALFISMLFAVLCFGRRITYWWRAIKWRHFSKDAITNVFLGLNERSFVLAHDINKNAEKGERFIFVDFPLQEESPSKGQSFSGILGLFSYKKNAIKQLDGLNVILMKSSLRPSAVNSEQSNFFDAMNVSKIESILSHSKETRFFVMTNDEDANLKAAINMLKADVCKGEKFKIYCSARKTMLNRLIEEKNEDKLQLIDDSRTAVTQLKMDLENKRHPIDYVDIDKDKAVVTSTFRALIIGFGTTGQDALRFLYEYSAFPDEHGKKSPVEIHIIDNNMSTVKGAFWQEVPAMSMLDNKEVFFHNLHAGSVEFDKFLNEHIKDVNYVVVSAGNDNVNIDIASMIMDKAFRYRTDNMKHFKTFVRIYHDEDIVRFDSAVDVYKEFCSEKDNKPLEYFGNTKEIYTYKIIIHNSYEKQAIAFYNSYCKATNTSTTWEQRQKKEYDRFDKRIYGRRSLRRKEGQDKANCQHCYTKRMLLSLSERQGPLPLPEWNSEKSILDIDKDKITPWLLCLYNVSICEHLRWNASHIMLGYVPMTDTVRNRTTGTCDEVTKQHLCIVDWDKLDCGIQSYDYAVVRTTVENS